MTNEELKGIWAVQASGGRPVRLLPETIWQLAKASERFERTIFWRDVREWLGTAVAVVLLLWVGFRHQTAHWVPILAALIACVPMTYLTYLRWTRFKPAATPSLKDHLQATVASLQHQIGLLRSIFWWYLAPLSLSLMLMFFDDVRFGRVHFGGRFFSGTAVALAIFFFVWKLNRRAVRKDLEPRLRELERTLAELAA